MTAEKVSTEIVRRVYNDDEGCYLEVGPDGDSLGIQIRTMDPASEDWFGKTNLSMSPEIAKQLGAALIAAAGEFV